MSDPYDAVFASVMAPAASAPKAPDPYDKVWESVQIPGGVGKPTAAKPDAPEGLGYAANAFATGVNRIAPTLLGVPMDTAANVSDLLKAAAGAPWLLAGKVPPEALQVKENRENIPGTSAYNMRRAKELSPASFTAASPAYEGGYIQNAGTAAAAAATANPATLRQAANMVANNVAGATTGKAVGDATGNPALAMVGSMLPTAAQAATIAATKRAIRGGEEGRLAMEQRIADLKNAGIDSPTLGLASGNKLIGGVENLLQQTPGAVGVMARSRDAALAGIQNRIAEAAAMASSNRGSIPSGVSMQKGAQTFKSDVKGTQNALYDELGNQIGPATPTAVNSTRSTLGLLNQDIPGAENLSEFFKNRKIMSLEDALTADLTQQPTYTPSQLRNAMASNPERLADFDSSLGVGRLPFEAVKKTRTLVGNEIANNSLLSDVPRSKWNPLYGALTDDMRTAAAQAGPDATKAFNRANDYTRSSIDRMERIAPVVDRVAPEQTYHAAESLLRDNVSTFQALKKSLPEGARGDFAGTVIERLGKAAPGQQDATGAKWSPETFLTNWSKMSPEGQVQMLSGFPKSGEVKNIIDSVANATAMMRDNSRMWSNPSGSGANAFARGSLWSVGAGIPLSAMGLLSPMVPAGAAAAMGAANLGARALTSPNVVNSMASRTYIDPQILNSQINQLIGGGLLDYQH